MTRTDSLAPCSTSPVSVRMAAAHSKNSDFARALRRRSHCEQEAPLPLQQAHGESLYYRGSSVLLRPFEYEQGRAGYGSRLHLRKIPCCAGTATPAASQYTRTLRSEAKLWDKGCLMERAANDAEIGSRGGDQAGDR